jgi:hypothetical protein
MVSGFYIAWYPAQDRVFDASLVFPTPPDERRHLGAHLYGNGKRNYIETVIMPRPPPSDSTLLLPAQSGWRPQKRPKLSARISRRPKHLTQPMAAPPGVANIGATKKAVEVKAAVNEQQP